MAEENKFIQSIEIANFKCFEKLKIENLSNFNLFIGGNNIGKSSLLEFLAVFFGFLPPRFLQNLLWEMRSENLDKVQDFNMFFRNYDWTNPIGLSSFFENGKKIKLQMKYQNELGTEKINCKLCDENHSNIFVEWDVVEKINKRSWDAKNTDPIAKALENALAEHEKGFGGEFMGDSSLATYIKSKDGFVPKIRYIHRDFHLIKEETDLVRSGQKNSKQMILDFVKKLTLASKTSL